MSLSECPECEQLRDKIAALRTDRDEWRAVAVRFAGRTLALERQICRMGQCESINARHPYRRLHGPGEERRDPAVCCEHTAEPPSAEVTCVKPRRRCLYRRAKAITHGVRTCSHHPSSPGSAASAGSPTD